MDKRLPVVDPVVALARVTSQAPVSPMKFRAVPRIFLAIWAALLSVVPIGLAAGRPARPNVVLILTDDLGWQDVGCYDVDEPCPYETPNIDALSKRGIQFWQGYSPAPTCAPSRVAILSGKHPARAQKTHVVGGAPPFASNPNHRILAPWYRGGMPTSEVTIAAALRSSGYVTGAIGKWHVAIDHHAFPQPTDLGFDVSKMNRGATQKTKDRTSVFSTTDPDDPYRLDENGFPRHQNTIDAIQFIEDAKARPFFLYHANWLVHAPIHTRSRALLEKYCEKMGVPFPTDPEGWEIRGQKNPYYGAMVEALDYYTGQIIATLDETDDPRWPGHKLSENTYLIFTSDNGGMLGSAGEIYTSNAPLDGGKINAREGGVRVPLLIVGPDIPQGKESDAMVNGLDFYPTILSWTGTPQPETQRLDGLNLTPFLRSPDLDPKQIRDRDGHVRDTMTWHFPHSKYQSTIRRGGYKLIRRWEPYLLGEEGALELFQLYDGSGQRADIEEAKSLTGQLPELAQELDALLGERLDEMDASEPLLNPAHRSRPAGWDQVPIPEKASVTDGIAVLTYQSKGSPVAKAHLLYTRNGGEQYEEWDRAEAEIRVVEDGRGKIRAKIPEGVTHYVFNLIDENHFLVSYPDLSKKAKGREFISEDAIKVAQ